MAQVTLGMCAATHAMDTEIRSLDASRTAVMASAYVVPVSVPAIVESYISIAGLVDAGLGIMRTTSGEDMNSDE